jgi:hypothetical protein
MEGGSDEDGCEEREIPRWSVSAGAPPRAAAAERNERRLIMREILVEAHS